MKFIGHMLFIVASLVALAACGDEGTNTSTAEYNVSTDLAANGISAPVHLSDEQKEHYLARVSGLAQNPAPSDSILMLGDETIENGDWQSLLSERRVANYGIAGDTADGVLGRLDQVLTAEPERVFIMVGYNDLLAGREVGDIADDIRTISRRLVHVVPADKIYLHTVLPEKQEDARQVAALNRALKNVAYRENIWFVHLDEQIVDDRTRSISAEHAMPGGSLKEEAYAFWADFLQPYFTGYEQVPDTGILIPEHYSRPAKTQYFRRVSEFARRSTESGAVAFVGDSITEGGDFAELFPTLETLNFGIGWDQTSGVLNRIDQVKAARPSRIVLLIGTNDIGKGRPLDVAADNVRTVLQEFQEVVPPENIVLHSVMPRKAARDEAVRDLNARLAAVAEQEGVAFVDLYEPFLLDGQADPALTRDGLHPNQAGYERWRSILEPYLPER